MNADTLAVLRNPPSGDAWDFGGFPYGLEPLALPMPELGDESDPEPVSRLDLCDRIRYPAAVEPADDADVLYWFRWITGHQVSFAVWRLMAQALRRTGPESATALARYVRGYCAMLLYTSSCPPELYHRLIRPSMRLQHRGFSGSWAPDFRPVRGLLRGRTGEVPGTAELTMAVRFYEEVHVGIAAKLVPDGRSLLRQAVADRNTRDTRMLGLLYDNYFMTIRGPVARADVVAQLMRRLVAVAQDIAANGLYPSPQRTVPELATPVVAEFERDVIRVIHLVARTAAEPRG